MFKNVEKAILNNCTYYLCPIKICTDSYIFFNLNKIHRFITYQIPKQQVQVSNQNESKFNYLFFLNSAQYFVQGNICIHRFIAYFFQFSAARFKTISTIIME